jgi:biotin operon repressor
MAKTKTRVAAAVIGGAMTLGAIAVSATVAAADPLQTPSGPPSGLTGLPDGPRPDGDGFLPGPDHLSAAKLAEKLGLSEDKVGEALRAVREELRAERNQDPSARPSRAEAEAELAERLAEKLGVDRAAVAKAIAELRSAAQADALASLKERLAGAVRAGTLTQAEAEAVVKAVEAGVIPAGLARR